MSDKAQRIICHPLPGRYFLNRLGFLVIQLLFDATVSIKFKKPLKNPSASKNLISLSVFIRVHPWLISKPWP